MRAMKDLRESHQTPYDSVLEVSRHIKQKEVSARQLQSRLPGTTPLEAGRLHRIPIKAVQAQCCRVPGTSSQDSVVADDVGRNLQPPAWVSTEGK